MDQFLSGVPIESRVVIVQIVSMKDEAQRLLHPRHIVLCRLNNLAVRGAHELLVARPHPQVP